MFWDRFLGFCRKRRFFRAKAEDRLAGGLEEASLVDYRAAWIQPPMYHTARQWSEDYKPEAYGFPKDLKVDEYVQRFDEETAYLYSDASKEPKGCRAYGLGVFMGFSHPLTCSIRVTDLFTREEEVENQELEALAAIIALKLFEAWEVPKEKEDTWKPPKIVVRSDCDAVVEGMKNIKKVYKDPRKYGRANPYLKQLYLLARSFKNGVTFEYVKAHASDPGNLEADRLAAWPKENAKQQNPEAFKEAQIMHKAEEPNGESEPNASYHHKKEIVDKLFGARPEGMKRRK